MLVQIIALAGLFVVSPVIATRDGDPQAKKTALDVQKPRIAANGRLFDVTFTATVTIANAEKQFVGVGLYLQRNGVKDPIALFVNLPDAGPKPGEGKPVRFTGTSLPKGNYTGKASMMYTDKDGESQTIEIKIDRFKVE